MRGKSGGADPAAPAQSSPAAMLQKLLSDKRFSFLLSLCILFAVLVLGFCTGKGSLTRVTIYTIKYPLYQNHGEEDT